MENLEKFIQDNLENFNLGEMPSGHRERFLKKLELDWPQEPAQELRPHRRLIRRSIYAVSVAAAAIIIALFAIPRPGEIGEDYNIGVQELAQQMYIEETELLLILPEDDLQMINSVKSITNEAIPLTDLLPDELATEKKIEILMRYYKAKTEGLRKIKTLYAQSNQEID